MAAVQTAFCLIPTVLEICKLTMVQGIPVFKGLSEVLEPTTRWMPSVSHGQLIPSSVIEVRGKPLIQDAEMMSNSSSNFDVIHIMPCVCIDLLGTSFQH